MIRDERVSHQGLDAVLTAGEPRVLCTFQLDTRSFYRLCFWDALCVRGHRRSFTGPEATLILMGDWRGSLRPDAARLRQRDC